MRIKTLLVTLGILGTSSLALADAWRLDRYNRTHDCGFLEGPGRYPDRYPRDGFFEGPDRYPRDRFLEGPDRYPRDGFLDGPDRYDRGDDGRYRPRTSWVPLTSHQQLDGRGDVFYLDTRERFVRLRLQHQTGRTYVRAIVIEFANGARQRVDVDRVLRGNHDMVNVELPGHGARRIQRIVVLGDARGRGTYQLYAM